MEENRYYFAGDPEKDSPRRHMQRVLSAEPESRSRNWWILGFLAGGSSWTVWRLLRRRRDEAERSRQ